MGGFVGQKHTPPVRERDDALRSFGTGSGVLGIPNDSTGYATWAIKATPYPGPNTNITLTPPVYEGKDGC